LPARFQATLLRDSDQPSGERIRYLDSQLPPEIRGRQLDLLRAINRDHAARAGQDSRLESMIESFELAFRMQQEAPAVFDTSQERSETLALYGIDAE
jgi:hypothetical protein